MSMTQRLLIPGLASVFALVSCVENPYDTPYDPYGRTRQQTPPYGTTTNPGPLPNYGNRQTPSPYGTPPTPRPYGQPTTPTPTPTPNPYGTIQPPPVTPPVTPPTPSTPGSYPVAQRTKTPGFVVSPYDADKVIDVSEFKSGQLARDPDTKKIFRVP